MKKIRLYDGRDKSFELIGTLEDICNYMGYDMTVEGIADFYDLEDKIESDNAGMNYYHIEGIEEGE